MAASLPEPPPLSQLRKYTIIFTVSWITLASTPASTSILSAMPEIASDLSTTVEIISIANAALLAAMDFSGLIWGPLAAAFGRVSAYNAAVFVLMITCIATALSTTLAGFTVTRVLGGLSGTMFMIIGHEVVSDICSSGVQGTAIGVFLSGSVIGPALGPCIGGIIVSYTTWRVIHWVQTAMVGLGLVLSLCVMRDIPNPHDHPSTLKTQPSKLATRLHLMSSQANPIKTLKYLLAPNILLTILTCSLLSIYQYFLLTTIRMTINPRFAFTTPLTSGLFYIAPGAGFSSGTMRYYRTRPSSTNAIRSQAPPHIRLRACLPNLFVARKSGLAVPIVTSFVGGTCLMGTYTVLNTYLGEALPSHRSAILAEEFILQYGIAALSSSIALPLIDSVGVGITFTICAVCIVIGACLTLVVAVYGAEMQACAMKRFPTLH
ncbi:major facilitator superfamily domain-containing protein [Aspergillus germanicus]